MNIIEVTDIANYLGQHWVHDELSINITAGEITAIVGGSGSGKTTLLRSIIGLQKVKRGRIAIFGEDIGRGEILPPTIRNRIGVMFQQGALFSSLTVQQNVAFPLKLHYKLPEELAMELALLKISMVGLPAAAASKYPSELSGGMIKRAAVARAIALDPDILFLDEPTAGLDPNGASALDALVLELRTALKLTIVLVTHDIDTLWRVPDRVAFLGAGRVLEMDDMETLVKSQDPRIHRYFSSLRSRAAQHAAGL